MTTKTKKTKPAAPKLDPDVFLRAAERLDREDPNDEWCFNYRDADGLYYTGTGDTGRAAIEKAKKFYDQRHADVAAKEAQRQKDVAAFNTWMYGTLYTLVGSLDAYLAGLEAGRKERP